ncbi:MAG TPA: Coq4 family protein [Myxococcota bacterium]
MTTPPAAPLPTLAPNASFLRRWTLAVKSLLILADDPPNPHYGPLLNACLDGGTYAKLAARWRTSERGRALLEARPTLQGRELDLEALRAMPPGTLGRAFMQYFDDNGIGPFETTFPIASDVDYLSKRYRETHDLLHVITGYGTDELGEMELQAFVLGNLGLKQSQLILSFGFLRQLARDGVRATPTWIAKIRAAHRRGAQSRELLGVPYETLWLEPVSSLSTLLCAAA